MRSPFPGLDPILEAQWDDIRPSLVIYTRYQLQPQLPKDPRTHVEESLIIVPPDPPRTDAASWWTQELLAEAGHRQAS